MKPLYFTDKTGSDFLWIQKNYKELSALDF